MSASAFPHYKVRQFKRDEHLCSVLYPEHHQDGDATRYDESSRECAIFYPVADLEEEVRAFIAESGLKLVPKFAGVEDRGSVGYFFDGGPFLFSPHALGVHRQGDSEGLPDETFIFPAQAPSGLLFSTLGAERKGKLAEEFRRAPSISVDKFSKKVLPSPDQASLFIDVREESEFLLGHVPGSRNLPLSELSMNLDQLDIHSRIYLLCLTGRRSELAARTLTYLGFDAVFLTGGYQSWKNLEYPVSTIT